MKRSRFTLWILLVLLFASCGATDESSTATTVAHPPSERLSALSTKMVSYLPQVPLDSNRIPRALESDGSMIAKGSRQWTSGFFPGTLWQLYGATNDAAIGKAAEDWTAFIEKEKWDDHTHDLGFKLYCSFGTAYRLNDRQDYKDIVVQASKTLVQRYNEKVGAIRSWDWNADVWEFPVIIDNMMNLEMLFEATRLTGDSMYHKIAHQHAKTTMQHHFRPDNSSYHVVVFDTLKGTPIMKVTHQGYSDDSAWSRGQAWGLYGYTMAYRYTKDPALLQQARKIAQFFIGHPNMPEDKIPYWDFNAPEIPDEVRDVSAAAVAASGLLELQQYVPEQREQYMSWVDEVLASLTKSEYQSDVPPFLLDHSTGSVPGAFEVDVPIVYADYYYVEALLRREKLLKQI
ncbi:MAG: glucuronyl hydrolase [Bacteroidota bacterium]